MKFFIPYKERLLVQDFLQLSLDSQDVHLDVHIVTLSMQLEMDEKCHSMKYGRRVKKMKLSMSL